MPNSEITVLTSPEPRIEDILDPDERLIWSGRPEHGLRYFQHVGYERVANWSMLAGTIVMWVAWAFIASKGHRIDTLYSAIFFGVVTIGFVAYASLQADFRKFKLNNFLYFLTDRRAIILFRGRNWRLATRLYCVAFDHAPFYPYEVVASKPYPSLRVGTLLSENVVQPFGFGLHQPGHSPLAHKMTSPAFFDYISNADDLLDIIQDLAAKDP